MVFTIRTQLITQMQKISSISYTDYLNKDIKVMDATAISLAKDRSLPIIIFSILKSSNILYSRWKRILLHH